MVLAYCACIRVNYEGAVSIHGVLSCFPPLSPFHRLTSPTPMR